MPHPRRPALVALALLIVPRARADDSRPSYRFDFTTNTLAPQTRRITPETAYRPGGFGFDLDAKPSLAPGGDSVTGDRPFFVSVDLPEGNYRVTVTLGDRTAASETTVKAESRRLMLERVRTEPGRYETRTFAVNTRTPRIPSGGAVRLKDREKGVLDWDEKLTLEFNGPSPHLRTLEIVPAGGVVTVFLLGDSTVTDQPSEPWNSWGQMLPRFFGPGVAVANHAESGESLRSSGRTLRFDKVYDAIRPGDYVFVQYGHNDQKDRFPGAGAFTTYKADLAHLVEEVRRRRGRPVLVTPVHRRTLDASGRVTNSLGDYPAAVRRLALEAGVPLIDLTAMSKTLYEALGRDRIAAAFVDDTHHSNYGGYELARCVVEGIRSNVPDLASLLTADAVPFDPARPDPTDAVRIPPSPQRDPTRPLGN